MASEMDPVTPQKETNKIDGNDALLASAEKQPLPTKHAKEVDQRLTPELQQKLSLLRQHMPEEAAQALLQDMLQIHEVANRKRSAGRPHGAGSAYSGVPLTDRAKRGVGGGAKSNRLKPEQNRLKVEHGPKTLKVIADKTEELLNQTDSGKFAYGSIAAVKRALP